MNLNENTIKGKWLEIKGDLQKTWGKLTDDELDQTKGDIKSISGLIQQRYGDAKENYDDKVSAVLKRYSDDITDKKDQVVDSVRSNIESF